MDTLKFEASLKADGYAEIETKTYQPHPANGEHGHHFAVRGLVLDGAFTVIQDQTSVTYGPGDTFTVPNGHLHAEAIGPNGARVLVGRKY